MSELVWAGELADTKGLTLGQLLDSLGSQEYTFERARAIVNRAARALAEQIAERKAAQQRRRGRRR